MIEKEIDIHEVAKQLTNRFELKFEVIENKIYNNEFNGHIANEESCEEIEVVCRNICDYIVDKYDCFADYSLIKDGEIVIEVF